MCLRYNHTFMYNKSLLHEYCLFLLLLFSILLLFHSYTKLFYYKMYEKVLLSIHNQFALEAYSLLLQH